MSVRVKGSSGWLCRSAGLFVLTLLGNMALGQPTISTPVVSGEPGEPLVIPILLSEGTGIGSGVISLSFDETKLSVPVMTTPCGGRVVRGSLLTDAHVFIVSCSANRVLIGFGCGNVCSTLKAGMGSIAEISFDTVPGSPGPCGLSFELAGLADDIDASAVDTLLELGTCTIGSTGSAPADLSLFKTGPQTANAGAEIVYTLEGANAGPSSAFNVSITDTLPVGMIFDPVGSSPACTAQNGSVECLVGDLQAGESASVTLAAQIAPDAAGTALNAATISASNMDPDTTNNMSSVETTIQDISTDLSLSKTASPTLVLAEEEVTFRLTASNAGPRDAPESIVVDTLPGGLIFTPDRSSPSCSASGNRITCELGTIPIGQSRSAVIAAATTVLDFGELTNQASVQTSAGDPNLENNQASATFEVTPILLVPVSERRLAVVNTIQPAAGRELSALAVLPDGRLLMLLREQGPSDPASIVLADFSSQPAVMQSVVAPEAGASLGVAVDPQGQRAYVAVSAARGPLLTQGRNRVDVWNVTGMQPSFVSSIPTPGNSNLGPVAVESNESGTQIYVTDSGNGVLHVLEADVDEDLYSLAPGIFTNGTPVGLAVKSDRIFVSNRDDSTIRVIDPNLQPPGQLTATIQLDLDPSITITDIVCALSQPRCYAVYPSPNSLVAVIDTGSLSQIGNIDLTETHLALQHLALSDDGSSLFVLGSKERGDADVVVVDLSGQSHDQRIVLGTGAVDVVFAGTPDAVAYAATSTDIHILDSEASPFLLSPLVESLLLSDAFEDSNHNGTLDLGTERRFNLLREGDHIVGLREGDLDCIGEAIGSNPHPTLGTYQTWVFRLKDVLSAALSQNVVGKSLFRVAQSLLGISDSMTVTATFDSYDESLRPMSLQGEVLLGNVMPLSGRMDFIDSDQDGIIEGADLDGGALLPVMRVEPTTSDASGDGVDDYMMVGFNNKAFFPLADTNGDGIPDTVALDFDGDGTPDPDLPLMPALAGPTPPLPEIRLHFAQLGNGAQGETNIFSQVVLYNLATREAHVDMSYRGDSGEPLSLVINGEIVNGEQSVTIPPGGLRTLSTDGTGPLVSGSVTAISDTAIGGVLLFGGSVGVAGVGASRMFSEGFSAPMTVDSSQGINTGIAVANLEPAQALVILSLRDPEGTLLATGLLELAALGHSAIFVDQIEWAIMPDADLDFDNFFGTLSATSRHQLAATVIQTQPGEFATQPVAPPPMRSAGSAVSSGLARPAGPSPGLDQELYFAQFGNGSAGAAQIRSEIVLYNPAAAAANAELFFRDSTGQPLSLDLNGQQVDGQIAVVVPGNGLVRLASSGSGPIQTGWVRSRADRAMSGVVLFSGSAGAAGVGSGALILRGFEAPMETSTTGRIDTGIAVANLEETESNLSLILCDSEGVQLASAEVMLPAEGHLAQFLSQFPWQPAGETPLDFSEFEGVLKVRVEGKTSATVIQTRTGVFATLPVVPSLR